MTLVQANISTLYSKLNEFRANDRYCDITIRVDEVSFKCHRLILAATCEYFDVMLGPEKFKEGKAEIITLENMDAAAFAEVLSFAYTGKVTVTAENAHSLISASDVLGLSFIEELCIEYIQQKIEIPIKNIVHILVFASATMKHSLTKVISEYIVANFHTVSKADEFLDIPLEDFRSLLDKYRNRMSSSSVNNELVLNTIMKWVHHARQERILHFPELINIVGFEKISSGYMKFMVEKMFIDTTTSPNFLTEYIPRSALSLHVYTRWKDFPQMNIFSLVEHDDTHKWHYSCSLPPREKYIAVPCPGYNPAGNSHHQDIRSVPLGNYLYSLNFDWDHRHQGNMKIIQKFYAASSINLKEIVFWLKSPPVICSSFEICTLRNNIYLYNRYISQPYRTPTNVVPDPNSFTEEELARGFYGYDRGTDMWFSVAPLKNMVSEACVTADNDLVYMIGGLETTTFQAYDSRMSQWQELPACNHFANAACCVHEGKIFVSGGVYNQSKTEIFDLVAGKWQSDVASMKGKRYSHRLVSYKGRVWAIGNHSADSTIEIYDSMAQEWCNAPAFGNAVKETQVPGIPASVPRGFPVICHDAVVF